ncbi:RHS repeat-associated core domain-containing protein [Xanthomonas sp. F4]
MSRITTLFLCSAAAFLGMLFCFDTKAQDKPWSYWYKGNWGYQSLKEAENAMHSDGSDPKFQYMEYRSSYVDPDGVLMLQYSAPDRSAIPQTILYAHGLFTENHPCESGWCGDEQTVVKSLEQELSKHDAETNCSTGPFNVTGSYSEPFGDFNVAQTRESATVFYYGDAANQSTRQLEFKRTCANGQSQAGSIPLFKKQDLICESGYEIGSYEKADLLARWADKRYCRPKNDDRWTIIAAHLMQVSTCAANANPCYPSTGDKARFEPDFTFAGRKFVRSYHSLRQLSAPYMARGWSHTFQESISTSGADKLRYLNEYGYIELFTFPSSSSTTATGSVSGRVIQRDPNNFGAGWKVFDEYGDVRIFDYRGRLVSLKSGSDARGNIRFTYDESTTKLLSAMDDTGRELLFGYSGDLLAHIYLPDGNSVEYTYTNGDLTGTTVAGFTKTYSYQEDSLLTGIKDETGSDYAKFSYDNRGRVASSALLDGKGAQVEVTSLKYADDYNIEVAVDGMETQKYVIGPGLSRRITSMTDARGTSVRNFDTRDNLASTTDRNGNQTEYFYNNGLLTNSREYIGDLTSGKRRDVSIFRDEVGRKIGGQTSMLDGGKYRTSLLSKRSYDISGRVAAECRMDPSVSAASGYNCGSQAIPPTGVRQVRYERCTQANYESGNCPYVGALLSVRKDKDSQQVVATFSYYSANASGCETSPAQCRYRKGDLWKATNALGQVTEYLAYDGAGRVLTVKDANGRVTDFTFHPRGWLTATKVRGADDSTESDDRITLVDYWPNGLVKQVAQPDGTLTRFAYDAAHRLTDIADNAGNTIHYTLDSAGNRVKEDTKDASGALKRTLSRVYNQFGQLATQATAQGNPTDFGYDANDNATTVTDALGHKTQNDYDGLNRLTRTLQDVGGIAAETKFSYDALDNITNVTDPKGLDTSYVYNGLGDMTAVTSPDTSTTTYTYDTAGNRSTQTDARNVRTSYSYDALNRLTQVAYPTTSLNIRYTYDVTQTTCASGETYGIGRLTRMQDGSGSTDYCYDRFGDLVRKVQSTNGKVFVLRYAYTKAGQLSRLTYPDGTVVDYVRNAQGQTTEIGVTTQSGSRQVVLKQATYYPFGPVAGWTYGNGRPMQRVLDQDYRPLAVNDTRSDGLAVGFAFDPAGNLSALTAPGNTAPVVSLDYDALGRLTAFKDGPTGTVIDGYSYDATGNRVGAKVNTATQIYTYSSDNHRLSSVGTTTRSYDAAGNTTAIGGTSREFIYDDMGRMSQAKRSGSVAMTYSYNGRGEQVRRFAKTSTYTVYDETGHWLGDYDNNGAVVQQAIWLDDMPVGVLVKTALRYVEPDHLGTPRAVIDPVRDVAIWRWDLKGEAFGATAPDQDPDKDGTAFVFNMRFPGQRYDAQSGLNQNYFRDYDSVTGRYVQSDPIGLAGGPNTFAYAGLSPAVAVDPSGLAAYLIDVPPENRRPAGSIYCVDGIVKPYYNYSQWPDDYRQCSEVADCVAAHEMSHVADANRSNPNLCQRGPLQWMGISAPPKAVTFPSTPAPGQKYSELDISEFYAHAAELDCLRGKLTAKNSQCDAKCKAAIIRRIKQITNIAIPSIKNGTYGYSD